MNGDKIHIVGIGDDGLDGITSAARQLIDAADLLVGSCAALATANKPDTQQLEVGHDLEKLASQLSETDATKVVVLASGDPLFFGTARYLCDKLGKDNFEVLPHVSSMQLAFARVKESWDEAYLTNLASQPLERVAEKIRTAEKVGIFTTEETPPAKVAQALLDRQIEYFTAYVCENLGSPDERVTLIELSDLAEQQFSPLNVMILVRKPNTPDRPTSMLGRRLFGNPDETFRQSKPKRGLLTSSEVRVMALAELDLGNTSVVWDVGAGSGSIAIEAAQIASSGTVYAIEMDTDDQEMLRENLQDFGITNVVPIHGQAPEAWAELPDPDAVFIGGTGRTVPTLVEQAYARLKVGGRLVANVGSIENLSAVHEVLNNTGADVKVWMVNIAHGTYQLERVRFEARNPTFLIGAVKV